MTIFKVKDPQELWRIIYPHELKRLISIEFVELNGEKSLIATIK